MLPLKEHIEAIFGEYGNTSIECTDEDVPSWYDETKFRRAQKYFQKNQFGILMSKLCGILCLMGVPEILKWTSRNFNIQLLTTRHIFERNRKIIINLKSYYLDSFGPKTKFWYEMHQFRKLLEISTKNGRKSELTGINQRFLAFVQYSNLTLMLTRPEKFGISTNSIEDIEAIIHFWRVIGWLFGISDSVNICRPSVSETKDLCEALNRNIFFIQLNLTTICIKN